MRSIIRPGHQSLYNWHEEETEHTIDVTLDLPIDLNLKDLSIDISRDPDFVVCRFPNELPFIAGRLFGSLTRYSHELRDELFVIHFFKRESGRWQQFIVDFVPDTTDIIDPQSAWRLALLFQWLCESPEVTADQKFLLEHRSTAFLNFTVAVRYVPALIFKASPYMPDPDPKSQAAAAELLRIGADDYQDPDCTHLLGVMAFMKHDFVQAEALFQSAASHGHIDSEICLGELYSPAESGDTGLQNPARAFEVFQGVLQRYPGHPFALFGMARLYLNGNGVTKDVALAKRLYLQARQKQPNIPAIDYEGRDLGQWTQQGKDWKYVIAPAAALILFGAVVFFRIFRRRQ
jgi:hypothetical protein